MTVTVHTPAPPLDAYIKCLWYCEGPLPYPRLKVLPMPSLHLMFNFGDAYRVYDADHAGPLATCTESWSVGLWNTQHVMDWPSDMQLINVSFKPGGAYPFLQLPLSELHNRIVPLDAVWGNSVAEIRERLYCAPTMPTRFALLEQLLLARLREAPQGLSAVQNAVAEIAGRYGVLSIRALSERMGISHKHLVTRFKRLVGGTPKELARIYRFRHVLYSLDPSQPVNWTQVAYQSGYYDQAHFNKDFEAFVGHNPGDYLRLLRQVRLQNPEIAPGHLPVG